MEETHGLNLAFAVSSTDYERSPAAHSLESSIKGDFDYALRLQQEEYARQRANEPESLSSRVHSTSPTSTNSLFLVFIHSRRLQ